MPKVLNINTCNLEVLDDAAYIGRGSAYGNPFIIGIHGDRETCIKKFQVYWESNLTRIPDYMKKLKDNIKGKNLKCYCSPLPCHGDFLLRWANEPSWKTKNQSKRKKRTT